MVCAKNQKKEYFALEQQDIDKINSLTQQDGRLKGQDPASYEEF